MTKTKTVRKTITENLGSLDVSYCSYSIAELVERFGADATLSFDYDYDPYAGCCGERIAECKVTRQRLETDDEYNARIASEKAAERKAAATRAEKAAAKARADAAARVRKEVEERKLYAELRKKFGE